MIGRTLWLLLLAALALIAGLAQLDRAARSAPELAALVPVPFRGFAAERLAEQALAAEDGPAASRAAVQLIRARPLPAEHLRILSQAAALQGDSERALAALEDATTRGWRDPFAQLAAAQSALLQGRYDAAAQRIGAMFAANIAPPQRDALLAALLAEPGGRAAFARYLAAPSRGRNAALATAGRTVPAEILAPTLALAEGADLPCDQLGVIAESYRAAGNASEAARFWPGNCPQS